MHRAVAQERLLRLQFRGAPALEQLDQALVRAGASSTARSTSFTHGSQGRTASC